MNIIVRKVGELLSDVKVEIDGTTIALGLLDNAERLSLAKSCIEGASDLLANLKVAK
jgi:hypothetical protein